MTDDTLPGAEAREKHAEWLAAPPKRRTKRGPSTPPSN